MRRHNTQHNNKKCYNQHNEPQHNEAQHNDTFCQVLLCWGSFLMCVTIKYTMLKVIPRSVVVLNDLATSLGMGPYPQVCLSHLSWTICSYSTPNFRITARNLINFILDSLILKRDHLTHGCLSEGGTLSMVDLQYG